MIPHTLQLKNFLSYGADFQTIDFRPYRLMYLSGRNGHGKSALLDAMTWAVWGVARKTTNAVRADQGLLRLGQLQMAVVFDFEVNGQLYRVKREFLKTQNKPLAQLEFGLLNPETGAYVPLTDKTIRATQAKLEETIKLDFDSFVNSAFLRQGNANEFSKKSPKDRKEVLSYILGLQQFDRLKKRALEKVKALQGQRTALAALQESYEKQLALKEPVGKELEALEKEQKISSKDIEQFAARKQALEKEQQSLAELRNKKEMVLFKQQQLQEKSDTHKKSLRELFVAWRATHKKQRNMPDIAALDAQHKKSKTIVAQQDDAFKKAMALQQDQMKCTQAISARKAHIERAAVTAQQELQIQKERCGITLKNNQQSQAQLQKECDAITKDISEKEKNVAAVTKKIIAPKEYAGMQAQFEKRKETYYAFVAQRDRYATEQHTLIKKQSMVSSDDPSCPLCEQNLSAARKKFLKNKCGKEARFAVHQYERLARIVPQLKEILVTQHAQLEEHKKQSADLQGIQKDLEALTKNNTQKEKELGALAKHITELEKEHGAIDKKLAAHAQDMQKSLKEDKESIALQAKLSEHETQLKALAYDEKVHKKAQHDLQAIEKERESLFALQQDVIKQADRAQAIAQLVVQLKEIKKHAQLLVKELKQFDSLAQSLKALEQKQAEFEKQVQEHARSRETLRQKQGALLQKKEHLQQVQKEAQKQADTIKTIDAQISDYQEIASAAGKDGIQALLIEDAIPEIEQEANQLLSRLTHNQSHIAIESLRDLKRGGTKETLDINISDPSGIRPYELFSGGEAFRIDFALRIAISKLLARRAGTSLQTLIIDEGFGSQDEEGLSLIMDAIHEIQDDFEKVIVVSHLPAMRDQFPVHFNVEKGPSGSCVKVVELG